MSVLVGVQSVVWESDPRKIGRRVWEIGWGGSVAANHCCWGEWWMLILAQECIDIDTPKPQSKSCVACTCKVHRP